MHEKQDGPERAEDGRESRYHKRTEDYTYSKKEDRPEYTDMDTFHAWRKKHGITGDYSPNLPLHIDLVDRSHKFKHEHGGPTEDDSLIAIFVTREGQNSEGKPKMSLAMITIGCQEDIVKLLVANMEKNPNFAEVVRLAMQVYKRREVGELFEHLSKIFGR